MTDTVSASSTPSERITIDPQGDVCLVTDGGNGKEVGYIVSSQVLRVASKVFAAMFSSKFAEDQMLRAHWTGVAVTEVLLSDDDATGMEITLEFVHFCPRPETIELHDLTQLAIVVDKYQCQSIFKAPATTWILESIEGDGLSEDLPEYLDIAIAFESARPSCSWLTLWP